MRLRSWIRAFFGFSRTETNGFLILIPLILVLLFSEPLYRRFYVSNLEYSHDNKQSDSLIALLKWDLPDSVSPKPTHKETHRYFNFDPNAVTKSELLSLKMSDRMASRLMRYREKGGVFRKKEDLLKLYGMDTSWFHAVKDFITLAQPTSHTEKSASKQRGVPIAIGIADINTADSIQLIAVYGIGPVLAKRIKTFRDRLEGFNVGNQTKRTWMRFNQNNAPQQC